MSLSRKLMPTDLQSGLEIDGYSVWGGKIIKDEDGKYCMFAARCKDFFENHMHNAEIILAVTDDLEKPFRYERTVLPKRGEGFWDSETSYSPEIIKIGEKYVLFYSGSAGRIGYAVSDTIHGEFIRSDDPIEMPFKAYDPTVAVDRHGTVMLYVRNENKKVKLLEAKKYNGAYEVMRDDIFPLGMVEDMSVYPVNFGYKMIAIDSEGMYCGETAGDGALFRSSDGLYWHPGTPAHAFGKETLLTDGNKVVFERRSKPAIFNDNGNEYLVTSVCLDGKVRIVLQRVQ